MPGRNRFNKQLEINQQPKDKLLTLQKDLVMPLCAELEDSSPEQVELDCHLGGHGGVDDGGELMGGEDPQRVVPEVQDRDELKRVRKYVK